MVIDGHHMMAAYSFAYRLFDQPLPNNLIGTTVKGTLPIELEFADKLKKGGEELVKVSLGFIACCSQLIQIVPSLAFKMSPAISHP